MEKTPDWLLPHAANQKASLEKNANLRLGSTGGLKLTKQHLLTCIAINSLVVKRMSQIYYYCT